MKDQAKGDNQPTNHKEAFVKAEACLIEDLQKSGCPICNHMEEVMFDYLATWQYTLINDENVQREYAAERGFCPTHTWQLAAMSSQMGISRGYPTLLEHIAEVLLKMIDSTTNISEGIDTLVKDSADCRICHLLKNREEAYVRCLAAFLEQEKGLDIYACSHGVCLRHLRLLVSVVTSQEMIQFLLSETSRHFKETADDMHHYVLKRYNLQRHLISDDEQYAYLRALIYVAGKRNVCIPHIRRID